MGRCISFGNYRLLTGSGRYFSEAGDAFKPFTPPLAVGPGSGLTDAPRAEVAPVSPRWRDCHTAVGRPQKPRDRHKFPTRRGNLSRSRSSLRKPGDLLERAEHSRPAARIVHAAGLSSSRASWRDRRVYPPGAGHALRAGEACLPPASASAGCDPALRVGKRASLRSAAHRWDAIPPYEPSLRSAARWRDTIPPYGRAGRQCQGARVAPIACNRGAEGASASSLEILGPALRASAKRAGGIRSRPTGFREAHWRDAIPPYERASAPAGCDPALRGYERASASLRSAARWRDTIPPYGLPRRAPAGCDPALRAFASLSSAPAGYDPALRASAKGAGGMRSRPTFFLRISWRPSLRISSPTSSFFLSRRPALSPPVPRPGVLSARGRGCRRRT